jgi:hypothetical protein
MAANHYISGGSFHGHFTEMEKNTVFTLLQF